ncbi:MAG: peptidyl-prolyl cis-trans isomerase, partial [Verrucomicrobiota bacterium]|nr:peptidyl-prolyl cis-trans isomerase [Verrucomicrobiota bacterium]
MKSGARALLLLTLAALAGWGSAELFLRSFVCRQAIGRFAQRGDLRALVHGQGVYDTDGDLSTAITSENLRLAARGERVSPNELERELDLLHAQFGDEAKFAKMLAASQLSAEALRVRVRENLQARHWLERQMAGRIAVSAEEGNRFYAAHSLELLQPLRWRARHLFRAAPTVAPPEVVDAQRAQIQALAVRLGRGEDFAQLAAEFSEDEATKQLGGDLGFFAAERIPPEFLAQIEKLTPGQTTAPFLTHLGFHIAQLTEVKPARAMSPE